jgi:hypothetical protein
MLLFPLLIPVLVAEVAAIAGGAVVGALGATNPDRLAVELDNLGLRILNGRKGKR